MSQERGGYVPVLARMPELDGIRGLLSVLVVLGHSSFPATLGQRAFSSMVDWYWLTMEIFFVISGYLIGRIVLDGLHKPGFLRTYIYRRTLRIWPLYYVVVCAALALGAFKVAVSGPSAAEVLPSLSAHIKQMLYLQNIELYYTPVRDHYQAYLIHTWSVSLEEQYYLLCPLLVLALRRVSVAVVLVLVAAVAVASTMAGVLNDVSTWLLVARAQGFALGLGLAFLVWHQLRRGGPETARHPPRWLAPLGAVAIIWLPLSVALDSPELPAALRVGLNPLLASSVLGLFLVATAHYTQAQGGVGILRWRPLAYLGEISYSTYLWHVPFMYGAAMVAKTLGLGELARGLLFLPGIFLFAACSYHYIELHFLRQRAASRSNRAAAETPVATA